MPEYDPLNDPVLGLIREFKEPPFSQKIYTIKQTQWAFIRAPLLLFYLMVVYKSSEITVACDSYAKQLDDVRVRSLFVFFDIEVFVFLGQLYGMLIWLVLKFIVNKCYHSGPAFTFKTAGVKTAKDVLNRNKEDALVLVGVFWMANVNQHLSTGDNYLRELTDETQKTILSCLFLTNAL